MSRRVAVTGANGRLGREVVRVHSEVGDDVLPLARPDFDITVPAHLDQMVEWRPDVVINTAAWTDVDGCARDPDRATRVNGEAAGAVAQAALRARALVVQVSTNEVFDGTLDRPYTELDQPNPINPYGASKLTGERLVAAANPRHLVIRTAWLFGPWGSSFVTKILAAAERARAEGRGLQVVNDEWGNPTWIPALARAVAAAIGVPTLHGSVLHLAGHPPCSRWDWATIVLDRAGGKVAIEPVSRLDYIRSSSTPPHAVLSTERAALAGISVGDWREATREDAA